MYQKTIDFLTKLGMAILLDAAIVMTVVYVYYEQFSNFAQERKIQSIYKELLAQSGQTQDALPLYVMESDVENAYNDGNKIVLYTAIANNAETWDEVALVLGHEIAHGMLGHLTAFNPKNADEVAVLEGTADKMGAVYAIKAGWDVCEGRNVFKRWKEGNGNALGQSHPDYSYRYDELNLNCGE